MNVITPKHAEPAADYGFFGPNSVTWKVWSYPTSFALGFIRATSIEFLDPNLTAAVVQSGGVISRPATRYDRTLHYFALVKFGDSLTATRAANVLVKVHAKAVGDDPVTGGRYDANDPDSQLWIHVTAWHSILYTYERFGGGRLSEAEENQYWAECAVAAELQTINVEDVPRSRQEVREYFARWEAKVCASNDAQRMMEFILDGVDYVTPRTPKVLSPVRRALVSAHRRAVISTYPRWMRQLAGIRQSRVTDALIPYVFKPANKLINALPWLQPTIANLISPSTTAVVAPMFFKIPATDPRTYTPQEARERLEMLPPREEYARFRAMVEQRRARGARSEAELGVGPDVQESLELIGPTAR